MIIAPRSAHDLTRRSLTGPAQLEVFAKSIITCCLDSWELFNLCRICLNWDETKLKYDRSDFLDPVDGLLFSGMNAFREAWLAGNPIPTTRFQWYQAISAHVDFLFSQHPDWPVQFKEQAYQRVLLLPPPVMGEHDRVCDGLIDYVTGIRYHQLEATTKFMDPAAKRDAFDLIPRTIRIPGQESVVTRNSDIMASIFAATAPSFPFATGVGNFDRLYASKAQRGDAWLAYGCPGGGKTILACQTLSHSAAIGKKVCFITTEVKKQTILIRSCCSHTGMSYSNLKGIVGAADYRNHPLHDPFTNWVHTVGSNFMIFEYAETPGASFEERLHKILDKFEKEMGCIPDMVIFDWIGKAIDEAFEDSWMKRELYNRVANKMADLANPKTGIDGLTLTLAQANPQVKNKTNLTEFDTADSKALAQPMEGVLGITSLMATEENGTGSDEVHRPQQFWVVPKCREEATTRVAVLREFDRVRFESPR